MKRMTPKGALTRSVVRVVAVAWLGLSLAAQADGVFDGSNPDVWVIDPVTGLMQGVDADTWVERYVEPLYPLRTPQQALVNNLARSSVPMRLGQPSISIAGLGRADASADSPEDAAALDVRPASGQAVQTIAVEFAVSNDTLAARQVVLHYSVARDGGTPQHATVTLCRTGQRSQGPCQPARVLGNGRAGVVIHLIENATYAVAAQLRDTSGQQLGAASRQYVLNSADPRGPRRDTDMDGLPDLIEQAIGLDPLTGDLATDADGDGWSNFDEWLRGADLAAIGDANAVPADDDGDGWSNVDEQWRGSRVDDPAPALTPGPDEDADSDAFLDRVLAFKQRPAARSLYEPEYLPGGVLRGEQAGKWSALAALTLEGERFGSAEQRVSDDDIVGAGLQPAGSGGADAVEATRSRAAHAAALGNDRIPALRVPAGSGVVIVANLRGNQRLHVHKLALPPLPTPSVAEFGADDFAWVTPEQWRSAYIAYLVDRLTASPSLEIDADTTTHAMVFEAMLSAEARLRDSAAPVLFSLNRPAQPRPWLTPWQSELAQRADDFAAGMATADGLAALLLRLPALLAAGGPLAALADFVVAQRGPDVLPAGFDSDAWIARRLVQSYEREELGCFIPADDLQALQQDPDAFAEFENRCPEFYTEDDLDALRAADRERRYLTRLGMLAGAPRLEADVSLLDPEADSDGDTQTNRGELAFRPLPELGLPWDADSDGDGLDDGVDPCLTDALNACLGAPQAPRLLADVNVQVREQSGGAVALVALYLDRPTDEVVVARVEVRMGDGQATAGSDFEAVTAEVRLQPGQQVALVEIPILDDEELEDAEQFELSIADISGAVSGVPDNRVPILIADNEVAADPPVASIAAPTVVDERASAALDGSGSVDNAGEGLQFAWTQLAGPAVTLDDADQPVATLTAPASGMDAQVRVQLTVTDAGGQSDRAEHALTVRAIEEPPRVLARAEFAVRQGDTLRVAAQTLFNNVEEPDGQALSLDGVATPPVSGALRVDGNGIEYDAPAAAGGVVALNQDNARELVQVGDTRVAFVALGPSFSDPASVVIFDSGRGETDTLLTTEDSISDLIGSPDSDVVFFNNGLNGDVYAWTPATGTQQFAGVSRPSLFSAVLDTGSGQLYDCNGATWDRFDPVSATVDSAGAACSGSSFGLLSAQRDSGVCIIEDGVLHCADAAGDLQFVHDFAADAVAMLARADELLVFIQNSSTGQFDIHAVGAGGQVGLLQSLPQDDGQLLPTGITLDDGTLVFTRKNGDAAQLMQWGGVASGPATELTTPQAPYSVRYDLGSLITDGSDLFWLLLSDDNEFLLAEVRGPSSGSPGRVTPRSIFNSDAFNTPTRMALRDGAPVFVQNAGEEGACDLRQAFGGGFVTTLQSQINCFNWALLGDVDVYGRDGPDFRRQYFADGVGAEPGPVDFGLTISDTAGNAVELPVRVDVQAP